MPRGSYPKGTNKDVNPQFLTSSVKTDIPVVGDITSSGTTVITLPVSRLTASGQTVVQCFEILKIYGWFTDDYKLANVDGGTAYNIQAFITSSGSYLQPDQGNMTRDPRTIYYQSLSVQPTEDAGSVVTAPVYRYNGASQGMMDYTDGDGNGILIGVDTLYLYVFSQETGGSDDFCVRILYRFRQVALSEYLGIVQSQQ